MSFKKIESALLITLAFVVVWVVSTAFMWGLMSFIMWEFIALNWQLVRLWGGALLITGIFVSFLTARDF